MLVTELGISMLVREVQPQKAQPPMLVTVLGITTFLANVSQPVTIVPVSSNFNGELFI